MLMRPGICRIVLGCDGGLGNGRVFCPRPFSLVSFLCFLLCSFVFFFLLFSFVFFFFLSFSLLFSFFSLFLSFSLSFSPSLSLFKVQRPHRLTVSKGVVAWLAFNSLKRERERESAWRLPPKKKIKKSRGSRKGRNKL